MEHKAYSPISSNYVHEAIFDGRDRVATDLRAPGIGNLFKRWFYKKKELEIKDALSQLSMFLTACFFCEYL